MSDSLWPFQCAHCGKAGFKPAREITRHEKNGMRLFCNRECFGLDRRIGRTKEEKRALKSAYDAGRRLKLAERLKAEKRAYYLRTYDPAKAAVERKAKMPRHVEYCRRHEYRAKKAVYDRRHRAQQGYGEFAEAFLVLLDLETEIAARASRYDIDMAKGALNKKKRRSRHGEIPLSG